MNTIQAISLTITEHWYCEHYPGNNIAITEHWHCEYQQSNNIDNNRGVNQSYVTEEWIAKRDAMHPYKWSRLTSIPNKITNIHSNDPCLTSIPNKRRTKKHPITLATASICSKSKNKLRPLFQPKNWRFRQTTNLMGFKKQCLELTKGLNMINSMYWGQGICQYFEW